jgi:hypothetical protein
MLAEVPQFFDVQNAAELWFIILHLFSNAENHDAKGHFFGLPVIKFPKSALTSGVKTKEMNPVPWTRADGVGSPKELLALTIGSR